MELGTRSPLAAHTNLGQTALWTTRRNADSLTGWASSSDHVLEVLMSARFSPTPRVTHLVLVDGLPVDSWVVAGPEAGA